MESLQGEAQVMRFGVGCDMVSYIYTPRCIGYLSYCTVQDSVFRFFFFVLVLGVTVGPAYRTSTVCVRSISSSSGSSL